MKNLGEEGTLFFNHPKWSEKENQDDISSNVNDSNPKI